MLNASHWSIFSYTKLSKSILKCSVHLEWFVLLPVQYFPSKTDKNSSLLFLFLLNFREIKQLFPYRIWLSKGMTLDTTHLPILQLKVIICLSCIHCHFYQVIAWSLQNTGIFTQHRLHLYIHSFTVNLQGQKFLAVKDSSASLEEYIHNWRTCF